jgi:hypothetical protein
MRRLTDRKDLFRIQRVDRADMPCEALPFLAAIETAQRQSMDGYPRLVTPVLWGSVNPEVNRYVVVEGEVFKWQPTPKPMKVAPTL